MTTPATVHFIGAGPGDPELLTLKAARLIAQAGLVLYAGSLVPAGVVAHASPKALVVDSSRLTLEQTHALTTEYARLGRSVARVHTGDPSLYGAVREQALLLDREGVPWEVVPGVTAAFAAAAEAKVSFTVPETTQSLVITRLAGRTPVPEREALPGLAAHGAAMAVYLSAGDAPRLQAELLAGGYAPDTAVVVGHKIGWPGGGALRTTIAELADTVREADIGRQAVFLVLPGESAAHARSKLYDPGFGHGWRAEDKTSGEARCGDRAMLLGFRRLYSQAGRMNVSKITWCKDFCVGVRVMDEHHERLVSMVNELFKAYMDGREKPLLCGIISALSAYTDYHFSAEERLMAEHGYPQSAAHKAEHREFVGKSIDFLLAYSDDKVESLTPEMLDYLEDWLLNHIRGTDAELGAYLRARGVE